MSSHSFDTDIRILNRQTKLIHMNLSLLKGMLLFQVSQSNSKIQLKNVNDSFNKHLVPVSRFRKLNSIQISDFFQVFKGSQNSEGLVFRGFTVPAIQLTTTNLCTLFLSFFYLKQHSTECSMYTYVDKGVPSSFSHFQNIICHCSDHLCHNIFKLNQLCHHFLTKSLDLCIYNIIIHC